MWPRRRNRAASAAILLLFHAFAGGHARRGHDGLERDFVSAAVGVRDLYVGPVSPSNGDGVRGARSRAADDARANAQMCRARVARRRSAME